jgi:hypothetical protein
MQMTARLSWLLCAIFRLFFSHRLLLLLRLTLDHQVMIQSYYQDHAELHNPKTRKD